MGEASVNAKRRASAPSIWPLIATLLRALLITASPCTHLPRHVLMATRTKRHVVFLILYQQIWLRRSMRLVATQAGQLRPDFCHVRRINHIRNGVPCYG